MRDLILLLIKIFDKEEHADSFVQNGELFCRALGEFKKIDNDIGRGDQYEAVSDWLQPDQVKMTISFKNQDGVEESFPVEKLAGPLIIQNNNYENLNLYCMYAVKIPDFEESYETEEEKIAIVRRLNALIKKKSTLNDAFLSLGQFAVVVYQVEDFINKVKKAAQERSYVCWNGSVEYYDPDTFTGSFKGLEAVFRKRNLYQHQNEYRFVFDSQEPEGNKVLSIGSLDGIAIKIPTKEINDGIELKLSE